MDLWKALLGALAISSAMVPALARGGPSTEMGPASDQLYIGTCYQPVDRSRQQILSDVALMKVAGLEVVRMGDLSWDYFEPANGEFDFAPFDFVMDQMAAAGIKVILDIPGTPAPMWAQQEYPGITVVSEEGATLYPAERYMDDISDPDFRRLQLRLADKVTKHYADHPAVLAVGYSNEIGNGYMSYSQATRQRFIAWLQERYGNLEALNEAWATQRWSRRISDWQQIQLPYAIGPGPSERYLDLRRFWSSVTINLLRDLDEVRQKNVPDKPALSNLYDSSSRRGFDYLSSQDDYQDYGALGYYASSPVGGAFETMMVKGDLPTPVWFNEFQTGFFGDYGTKGRSRMNVYLGLLYGVQGFLAWTFNTHLGGEEQIYFGLLNHDGSPSWKLEEVTQVASEFEMIEALGFPRSLRPEIAISYSFESRVLTDRRQLSIYYRSRYLDQKRNAFEPFYDDNIDVAVLKIGASDLSRYKLLVIAGEYLMDRSAVDAVRNFVSQGGTVIMTAWSAKADETGQWYGTPLPGALSDVFGLKTNQFYHSSQALTGTVVGETVKTTINSYEVLEPSTARPLGHFTNVDGSPPMATVNNYGEGQAIYVATTAQPDVLGPLYRSLYEELGIARGPKTPKGVVAREVDGRTLYVNTTAGPVDVEISGAREGLISRSDWSDTLHLEGYEVDLLE